MKFFLTMGAVGLLLALILCPGCTTQSPPVQTQVQTPVPQTLVATPLPTQTAVPFPDALTLDTYAGFGKGDMTGRATVYRYEIRPNYNWTAPSFNSPREQGSASLPLELQLGYNMEKPQQGNTFLFIYVRVQNTGSKAVYAPSPQQFVVFSDGKAFSYVSVHSSDVIIDGVSGTQYDYQIGPGGIVGYIQPGESNRADGYLIYDVPASFSPASAYVKVNLDYQNTAVWKLG